VGLQTAIAGQACLIFSLQIQKRAAAAAVAAAAEGFLVPLKILETR